MERRAPPTPSKSCQETRGGCSWSRGRGHAHQAGCWGPDPRQQKPLDQQPRGWRSCRTQTWACQGIKGVVSPGRTHRVGDQTGGGRQEAALWRAGVKTATRSSLEEQWGPRGPGVDPISPSLSCYSSDKADPDITTPHLHPERSGWRRRARIARRPNLEPGKTRRRESRPHCCSEVGRGCTKQSPTGKGSQQGPPASDESRARLSAQKADRKLTPAQEQPSWPRPSWQDASRKFWQLHSPKCESGPRPDQPALHPTRWVGCSEEGAGRSGQAATPPSTHTSSAPPTPVPVPNRLGSL